MKKPFAVLALSKEGAEFLRDVALCIGGGMKSRRRFASQLSEALEIAGVEDSLDNRVEDSVGEIHFVEDGTPGSLQSCRDSARAALEVY